MCTFWRSLGISAMVSLALLAAVRADDSAGERYLRAASWDGTSEAAKKAYAELAALRRGKFFIFDDRVFWPIPTPPGRVHKADDAMTAIYDLGLDAIPALADALDDTTPTNTFHSPSRDGQAETHAWRVNELAALLIVAIANREFVIRNGGTQWIPIERIGRERDRAPEFRKLVLDWYNENSKKTRLQRLVDQFSDEIPENRLTAIASIGPNEGAAGRDAITRYANRIMADPQAMADRWNSKSRISELAHCALALGRLHDANSVGIVTRICRELAKRVEETIEYDDAADIDNLFTANEGSALLGKKQQALTDLQRLYENHSDDMSENLASVFRYQLKLAAKWPGEH